MPRKPAGAKGKKRGKKAQAQPQPQAAASQQQGQAGAGAAGAAGPAAKTGSEYDFPWRTMAVLFFMAAMASTPTERAVYTFWEQNPFSLSCVVAFAVARFVQWGLDSKRRNSEPNPVWKIACCMLIAVGAASMFPMNKSAVIHEFGFLSREECEWVRAKVEEATSREGWTTTRHRYHPTEDVPVGDIPEIEEFMRRVLEERLQPFVRRTHGGRMKVFDMFIVRYTMGRQVSLETHMDGGHVSFDIALSDPSEFEGGGVFYKPLRRTLVPGQGQILVHPAKISHAGTEITSGTRYVLVGFSTIEPDGLWNMFRNAWKLWGSLAPRISHVTLEEQPVGESEENDDLGLDDAGDRTEEEAGQ